MNQLLVEPNRQHWQEPCHLRLLLELQQELFLGLKVVPYLVGSRELFPSLRKMSNLNGSRCCSHNLDLR